MSLLFLPGDPGFEETLAIPPPDWGRAAEADGASWAYVCRPGSGGVAEAVTLAELDEFLEGGEYGERLAEINEEPPVIWTPY